MSENIDPNNDETEDSEMEKNLNFEKDSKKKKKKDSSDNSDCKTKLSDSKSGEKWLKFGDFTLSMFDKDCIESHNEWLTDTIMNAAQEILQKQFPQIKGLQNVLLNEIQEFVAIDRGLSFVQIINDGGEHWIVLSNAKVENIERGVKIYDSKCLTDVNYCAETKNAILKLMSNSEKISVDIEYVSQQEDTNQCGLYAIAFAHALCAGEDPSSILFTNSAQLLRAHLIECFQRGEITRFPTGHQTVRDSYVL